MKTYHVKIHGKVQGVWYRASAKDKALEFHLTGKVWNATDGSVEAIVQGSDENITSFIAWCKVGPRLANVDEVLFEEVDTIDRYTTFEITR